MAEGDGDNVSLSSTSSRSRVSAVITAPALLKLSIRVVQKPSANIEIAVTEGRSLNATSPYVKIYLSKEGKDIKDTKQKTAVFQTQNPLFKYTCVYRLPSPVDDSHRIQISEVMSRDVDGWFKFLNEEDGRSRHVVHSDLVPDMTERERVSGPAPSLGRRALGTLRSLAKRKEEVSKRQLDADEGPDVQPTVGNVDVVVFPKPAGDVGFTLVGSCELDLGGTFVASVAPDSAAAVAGLSVGDRVLAVGPRGMLWASLKELQFELSTLEAEHDLVLTVLRGGAVQLATLQDDIAHWPFALAPEQYRARWGRGIEFRLEASAGRMDTIGRLLQRDMRRDPSGSLGAYIVGGRDTKMGAAFVTEVVAPDVDLQAGDRVLEVNGLSCIQWTQAEVLDQLRLGGATVRLVVQRLGPRQWVALQASANVAPHNRSSALRPAGIASARAVATTVPPATPATAAPGGLRASLTPADAAADVELQRERAVREQLQRNMFDLEQDAQAREAKLAGMRRELVETHGRAATLTQQLEQARRTIAQDQVVLRASTEREAARSAEMALAAEKLAHAESEKAAVLKSLSRTEKELEALRVSSEAEIKRLTAEARDARVAAADAAAALARLKDAHAVEVSALHEKVAAAETAGQDAVEAERQQHEDETAEAQRAHDARVAALQDELRTAQAQHRDDMKSAQEHLNRVAKLRGVTEDDEHHEGGQDHDESHHEGDDGAHDGAEHGSDHDAEQELKGVAGNNGAADSSSSDDDALAPHTETPATHTTTATTATTVTPPRTMSMRGTAHPADSPPARTQSLRIMPHGPQSAEARLRALQAEHAAQTAELHRLQAAHSEKDSSHSELQTHVAGLREQSELLQAQLQADIAERDAALETHAARISELEAEIEELKLELQKARDECTALQEQVQEVWTEKEAAELARDDATTQLQHLEQSCADLQRQVTTAADRAADHREEMSGVRAYADRLANELIGLKQFKALERASMPEESDDETKWIPTPKGRKR